MGSGSGIAWRVGRQIRRGGGVAHQDATLANDDPGVRIALGRVSPAMLAELLEGDLFVLQIGLGGEGFGGGVRHGMPRCATGAGADSGAGSGNLSARHRAQSHGRTAAAASLGRSPAATPRGCSRSGVIAQTRLRLQTCAIRAEYGPTPARCAPRRPRGASSAVRPWLCRAHTLMSHDRSDDINLNF